MDKFLNNPSTFPSSPPSKASCYVLPQAPKKGSPSECRETFAVYTSPPVSDWCENLIMHTPSPHKSKNHYDILLASPKKAKKKQVYELGSVKKKLTYEDDFAETTPFTTNIEIHQDRRPQYLAKENNVLKFR